MSAYTAWFNRHDLGELFVISPPERRLVTWEPDLVAKSSGYGSFFAGSRAQAMEITLRLTTFAATQEERLAALRTLSGWLLVDEPKKLFLTDERIEYNTAQYYLFRRAVPTGTPKVTSALNAMTAEVTFICPDARAYMLGGPQSLGMYTQLSFLFSSDEGYDGTPLGTAPTEAMISLHEVCGDSNGKFKLKVTCYDTIDGGITPDTMPDYGGVITIDVASDASAEIVIDSENRRYTFNGIRYPLPLSNNWARFVCGHRVTVEVLNGACADSSVTYIPRWW